MLLNEIQKDILCMKACYLLEDRLIKLFELPMSDINFYKYCLTPPPPGAGGIYILCFSRKLSNVRSSALATFVIK